MYLEIFIINCILRCRLNI